MVGRLVKTVQSDTTVADSSNVGGLVRVKAGDTGAKWRRHLDGCAMLVVLRDKITGDILRAIAHPREIGEHAAEFFGTPFSGLQEGKVGDFHIELRQLVRC
jgi:hypothetical protein